MRDHTGIRRLFLVLSLLAACQTPRPKEQKPVLEFPGYDSAPVPIDSLYRDHRRHTQRARPGDIVHVSASADGRSFVYASMEQQGTPQIYYQEADAVVSSPITRNSYENLFPRLSPDGKYVAYASNRDGDWNIYVAVVRTPTVCPQITLDRTDDIAPSWSPDGTKLAYCSRDRRGIWRIVLVDWRSRQTTILGPGLYPDWSAQGQIAFQTQPALHDARVGLKIIRPDGTEETDVTFDPGGRYSAVLPRWSGDGTWLVFGVIDGNPMEQYYSQVGRSRDLWVVRRDGRNAMALTQDDLADEWWPSWGGGRVFFLSDREDGYENIWSFEPRLFELEPLQEGEGK